MAGTITSANAVISLSVLGLFPTPVQLQNFTADDIFDVDAIEAAEVIMGVDGRMSSGFVYVPINMNISLQADSPSNAFFDLWWATQQQLAEVFTANGLVVLSSIGTKWALVNGSLKTYKPLPDAKRVLQPRRHTLTWQSVVPAVV